MVWNETKISVAYKEKRVVWNREVLYAWYDAQKSMAYIQAGNEGFWLSANQTKEFTKDFIITVLGNITANFVVLIIKYETPVSTTRYECSGDPNYACNATDRTGAGTYATFDECLNNCKRPADLKYECLVAEGKYYYCERTARGKYNTLNECINACDAPLPQPQPQPKPQPEPEPEPEPGCIPNWQCEKGDMFSGVEYAGKNTGYQVDGCGNKRLNESQCPVGEGGAVPDIAGECSPYDLDILSFVFCSLGLPYFILPSPETEPFPVSTLHIKKSTSYLE